MARRYRDRVSGFFRRPLVASAGGSFYLGEEMVAAAAEINKAGASFWSASDIELGSFDRHPDMAIIADWLEAEGKPLSEVGVMYWFAVSARSEWAYLPKRTLSEHRQLFKRISRLTIELREAINETGDFYFRGGGWGLRGASVGALLSDAERNTFKQALAGSENDIDPAVIDAAWPRVDELLGRIQKAAGRLADKGPVHAQPRKRGAERGYFVRRMGQLFLQRYKKCPTEVIAALTTVALDEVTDRELVAKLLK